MEWGILIIVLLGLGLGFVVLQATFAARHWERVIAEGDPAALREALGNALEGWREQRPPRGFPVADWQGLQSAALVAADRDRCRVSLLVDADVRVVEGRREEVGEPAVVARRVAVLMAERLLYDIPHVRFQEVQVDVHATYRTPDGASQTPCLLTTRVTRPVAAVSEWDTAEAPEILAEWSTRERAGGAALDPESAVDPDEDPLIAAEEPGAVLAVDGAPR